MPERSTKSSKLSKPPTWKTQPKSPVDTLKRVRRVLEDPRRWTQGAYGEAFDGHCVHGRSEYAVRWCLIGACHFVDGPFEGQALSALRKLVPLSITEWNDAKGRKHSEVLELIDRAIARASRRRSS